MKDDTARSVPISAPLYDASPAQAFRRFWLKYAVFSGRAGRAEYWWWALISTVVALVLEAARFVALGASLQTYLANPVYSLRWSSLPWLAWYLVTLVPTQALGVRRLHDSGRSGWWQLLSIAVLVATIVQTRLLPTTTSLTAPRPLVGAPLVASSAASIVSLVASVVLIVFYATARTPAGNRFDQGRPTDPVA